MTERCVICTGELRDDDDNPSSPYDDPIGGRGNAHDECIELENSDR